jgi:hypothetical protein
LGTRYETQVKVDRVWDFIVAYAGRNGHIPTHREIKKECRLSSTSVVNYYLWKLVSDGKLNKQKKGFSIRGARMIIPYS